MMSFFFIAEGGGLLILTMVKAESLVCTSISGQVIANVWVKRE